MKTLLFSLLWFYVFLLLFAVTMTFYRAKRANKLTPFLMFVGAVPIGVAYLMDIVTNYTFAWLLFWNKPKELLVTYRLERYAAQSEDDWRKKIALWLCDQLARLDPRDQHCFPGRQH